MISLTTKMMVSRMVMTTSWVGEVIPSTTPNEMRTAAVAKSAEMRVPTSTSMKGQLLSHSSELNLIVVGTPSSPT